MAARRVPETMKQILTKSIGTDFRKCTKLVDVPVPKPGFGEVLVKNMFVGINASDINLIAGRYNPKIKAPFPAGLEGIGRVVEAGADCHIKEGQAVVYLRDGAFCEYMVVPSDEAVPVPSPDPAFLSIILSGLTASIGLEKKGELKPGETVLVTAAAGGTGQFAVQLAKDAGCHVIGTCSNPDKVDFLRSIGCDRPINYKQEDLNHVLRTEYPKGVNVVYESIGKNIFEAAMKNIAVGGRLIVIGMISGYSNDGGIESGVDSRLPLQCLFKSADVRGFFFPHYAKDAPRHAAILSQKYMEGKLKVEMDTGRERPFRGLAEVPNAVEYMYSGKNIGKIVVDVRTDTDKSSL